MGLDEQPSGTSQRKRKHSQNSFPHSFLFKNVLHFAKNFRFNHSDPLAQPFSTPLWGATPSPGTQGTRVLWSRQKPARELLCGVGMGSLNEPRLADSPVQTLVPTISTQCTVPPPHPPRTHPKAAEHPLNIFPGVDQSGLTHSTPPVKWMRGCGPAFGD